MTIVSANLVEDPQWWRRQLLIVGNAGVTLSLLWGRLFPRIKMRKRRGK